MNFLEKNKYLLSFFALVVTLENFSMEPVISPPMKKKAIITFSNGVTKKITKNTVSYTRQVYEDPIFVTYWARKRTLKNNVSYKGSRNPPPQQLFGEDAKELFDKLEKIYGAGAETGSSKE